MKQGTYVLFVASLIGLSVFTPHTSAADPVYWAGNGHWYELVEQQVTWEEAAVLAESMCGMCSHLATITSAEENQFVIANVIGSNFDLEPWLGGFQAPIESPPDANWHWVTDEAWNFTAWGPSEPNDSGGLYFEYCLQYQPDGTWNDLPNENLGTPPVRGFVVEWSCGVVPSKRSTWGDIKATFQ